MAGRGIVGAGGGLGTGLLLLVGGLIVKHSQASLVAECSSGLGQLGQALNPNAATGCSGAQTLSSLATVAIWLGAIMLGFAVIGGIGMLAAAGVFAAQQKPKTVAAGTAGLRQAEPGTGTAGSPSPPTHRRRRTRTRLRRRLPMRTRSRRRPRTRSRRRRPMLSQYPRTPARRLVLFARTAAAS